MAERKISEFGCMVYWGGLLKIIEDLPVGESLRLKNTGEGSYVVAREEKKPR